MSQHDPKSGMRPGTERTSGTTNSSLIGQSRQMLLARQMANAETVKIRELGKWAVGQTASAPSRLQRDSA